MLVVADTSPLNYLVWIELVEVLPKLYGKRSFRRRCATNFFRLTLLQSFVPGQLRFPAGLKFIHLTPLFAMIHAGDPWTSGNGQRWHWPPSFTHPFS